VSTDLAIALVDVPTTESLERQLSRLDARLATLGSRLAIEHFDRQLYLLRLRFDTELTLLGLQFDTEVRMTRALVDARIAGAELASEIWDLR
jgi:CRP-like cAMP-binding protein